MAFSVSDLLNPAPASGTATPVTMAADDEKPNVAETATEVFAPELFQSSDDSHLAQAQLAAMAMDVATALESTDEQQESVTMDQFTHLKQEAQEDSVELENSQYPVEGLIDENDGVSGQITMEEESSQQTKRPSITPKYKSRQSQGDDKDKIPRSTKHSSKNEGQHTDRRYLCYLCNKLFTRRRSVRDHISKIHNTKTWEPVRSLEIIVDPTTGEPTEPLEDIIARGPPPPPVKPERTPKAERLKPSEEEVIDEETEIDVSAPAPMPIPEPAVEDEVEQTPIPLTTVTNLKAEPSIAGSRASSSEPFATPAPIIGKKRPAADSAKPLSAAVTKKGTAKLKSSSTPNKRPRLVESDSVSEKGTPAFRSPSAAPVPVQRSSVSKLKKQAALSSVATSPSPTSSREGTPEPASPSPSASGTPASSNDDGEIFCICRKGDNHTWMIACDGGCDEWFHGNCVNIRERDGDLIDKYVCPNCTKEGFQTTWKRMCRRKGCRKPARVLQDPPSKYCSKDCGRMFFVDLIRRGDPYIDTMKNGQYIVEGGRAKKVRKKRKNSERAEKVARAMPAINGDIGELLNGDSRLATPAYSDEEKSEYETDSSADEDQLPNRGGALRAGEMKALIEKCTTIEQWKELGRKPDTPPRDEPDTKDTNVEYDDFEKARLEELKVRLAELKGRLDVLETREKFLELVKSRSSNITDEVKKSNPKTKDPCGFDPRLAWSEEEFLIWYNGDGKTILESGKIGPPEDAHLPNRDHHMGNGVQDSNSEDDEDKKPTKGGVCVRNRCPRHRNWAKSQLAELRFEQDVVNKRVRRCEQQESDIRDNAIVKAWEQNK